MHGLPLKGSGISTAFPRKLDRYDCTLLSGPVLDIGRGRKRRSALARPPPRFVLVKECLEFDAECLGDVPQRYDGGIALA